MLSSEQLVKFLDGNVTCTTYSYSFSQLKTHICSSHLQSPLQLVQDTHCNTNRQLQLQSAQDTHSTLSTIAFTDIQSLYRYLLLVIVSLILDGTTHYCPPWGTLHIPLYDTLVMTSPSRPCNMFVMLLFSCNQLTKRIASSFRSSLCSAISLRLAT